MTEQERQEIARLQRRIEKLDAEALTREGRITDLVAEAIERDSEIRDLEAVRDVLTPSEIRAGSGLDVKTAFTAAVDGVAGDFYVVARGPDADSTVLAVGDVSGHGIEAARRATFVRASIATFARFVDDPCRLLELSNQVLVERTGSSSAFVTVVAVVVHPRERRIEWASAGHPPPMRLDSGEMLDERRVAPPLGLDQAITCQCVHDELAPGSGVLLFTDGLTEAHRPGEELFGERRVGEALLALDGSPAADVVARLESAALAHAGAALRDDLCIVAARVKAS